MHHFYRVSAVWHDPEAHVKRTVSLLGGVVLVEWAVLSAQKAFAADPVLLLGAGRSVEGAFLLLLGPWTVRGAPRKAAAKRSIGLALAVAACGVACLWAWKRLMPFPPPGLPTQWSRPAAGWGLFLFTSCVASPLAEELVFRGLLYRNMRRWCSFPFSAMVISLAFGGLHLLFESPFVLPFLGSLLFCAAYEKEKIFLAPLLLHMFGNAIIFLSPLWLSG